MTTAISSTNLMKNHYLMSNLECAEPKGIVAPKFDNEKVTSKVLGAELAAENQALGTLYSLLAKWSENLELAKEKNDTVLIKQLETQIERTHALAQQHEMKIKNLKEKYEFHSSVKY